MGRKAKTGIIVQRYIEHYPHLPKLTLARIIYNENNELFNSVEHARTLIRYQKGALGELQRKKIPLKDKTPLGSEFKNYFPEGIQEVNVEEFVIPSSKSVGIITDLHIPFHDEKAIMKACAILKDVESLVLLGDCWDAYFISRFEPNPMIRTRLLNTQTELEILNKCLQSLREIFDCPIYYKIGNHEDRWEKYLRMRAPELLDMDFTDIKTLLKFGELKIQCIDSHQIIRYGDYFLMHGHEFGDRGDARFVAKNKLQKMKRSVKKESLNLIFGHHHRTDHWVEQTVEGVESESWAIGGLLNLNPAYRPLNAWNHGCMRIDNEVENIRI